MYQNMLHLRATWPTRYHHSIMHLRLRITEMLNTLATMTIHQNQNIYRWLNRLYLQMKSNKR